MKWVVLNGSPKGDTGITRQYIKFIQKHYPGHDYVYHNISSRIRAIEANDELFRDILRDVETAGGIIWATPVYTLFVPAQYMRFIELIQERNQGHLFRDKPTAVITTSIHFHDHTAHRYMNAVCDDLDMAYLGYFSAEMDDILDEAGRTRLLAFAGNLFRSAEKGVRLPKQYARGLADRPRFIPDSAPRKLAAKDKKIVIVTDNRDREANIAGMIGRFSDAFDKGVDVRNLWDVSIRGGCMGCIRCGYDNSCCYNDEFSEFYRSTVLAADILVFATALTGRNFSWKMKEFFDRRFFMNHAPDLRGKQVVFLISGPVGQMPYMVDFCEGAVQWQNGNVVGIIRDDLGSSDEINSHIQHTAESAVGFSNAGYFGNRTFLGVGGAKIFRDDVWGKLRFVFQSDYRRYKAENLFDFPHQNTRARMVNAVMGLLTRIPGFRNGFYRKIRTVQVKPHQKAVERY